MLHKLDLCSLSVLTDPFLGKATVNADFVRVDVVKATGGKWSDVHMQVSPKEEVIARPVKPGGIPLDIALIMYDSTSAANFKRKMPKTLQYLTKSLNSILLEGIVLKSRIANNYGCMRRCVLNVTA